MYPLPRPLPFPQNLSDRDAFRIVDKVNCDIEYVFTVALPVRTDVRRTDSEGVEIRVAEAVVGSGGRMITGFSQSFHYIDIAQTRGHQNGMFEFPPNGIENIPAEAFQQMLAELVEYRFTIV